MTDKHDTERWNEILEGLDISRVEIRYIRKIVLKLHEKRQVTINVERLLQQNRTEDDIKAVIAEKWLALHDQIRNYEFVLNIPALSEVVDPVTDKILNKL